MHKRWFSKKKSIQKCTGISEWLTAEVMRIDEKKEDFLTQLTVAEASQSMVQCGVWQFKHVQLLNRLCEK